MFHVLRPICHTQSDDGNSAPDDATAVDSLKHIGLLVVADVDCRNMVSIPCHAGSRFFGRQISVAGGNTNGTRPTQHAFSLASARMDYCDPWSVGCVRRWSRSDLPGCRRCRSDGEGNRHAGRDRWRDAFPAVSLCHRRDRFLRVLLVMARSSPRAALNKIRGTMILSDQIREPQFRRLLAAEFPQISVGGRAQRAARQAWGSVQESPAESG